MLVEPCFREASLYATGTLSESAPSRLRAEPNASVVLPSREKCDGALLLNARAKDPGSALSRRQ
jgi:hypothetical protein